MNGPAIAAITCNKVSGRISQLTQREEGNRVTGQRASRFSVSSISSYSEDSLRQGRNLNSRTLPIFRGCRATRSLRPMTRSLPITASLTARTAPGWEGEVPESLHPDPEGECQAGQRAADHAQLGECGEEHGRQRVVGLGRALQRGNDYYATLVVKESMKQDVTASAMLETLNREGHVALYINFDTERQPSGPTPSRSSSRLSR